MKEISSHPVGSDNRSVHSRDTRRTGPQDSLDRLERLRSEHGLGPSKGNSSETRPEQVSDILTENIEKIASGEKNLELVLDSENLVALDSHSDLKQLANQYNDTVEEVIINMAITHSIRSDYGYNFIDKNIEEIINKIVESSQSIQKGFEDAISALRQNSSLNSVEALHKDIDNFIKFNKDLQDHVKVLTDDYKDFSDQNRNKGDFMARWLAERQSRRRR